MGWKQALYPAAQPHAACVTEAGENHLAVLADAKLAVRGFGIGLCLSLLEEEGVGGELGLARPDAVAERDLAGRERAAVGEAAEVADAVRVERDHQMSVATLLSRVEAAG